MGTTKRYDVVISFAGENRNYAKDLANALRRRNVAVFYDDYEKAALWGVNLYTHLSDVYQNQAQYCVILISEHYAKKLWTNHEREAAQARAFTEHKEYILPVRLDDTKIPGLPPTVGYLKWPPEGAESIANLILDKLKLSRSHEAIESAPTAPRVEVSIKPTVPDRLQLRCELDSEGRVNWSPLKTFASFLPFVNYFIRESCPVFSVAFSPDGTMLAFGSEDKRVYLWETKQAAPKTLYGHNGQVRSVTFSPDGGTLASGSTDRSVRIWRTSDGTIQRELLTEPRTEVSSIAFSPDGTVIASGGYDGKVRLWRIRDGKCLHIKEAHKRYPGVNNVTFSPDGKILASTGWDETMRLWQVGDDRESLGALLLTFKTLGLLSRAAFSPNGDTIACGCADNLVRLWHVTSAQLVQGFMGDEPYFYEGKPIGGFFDLAFSPDGKVLASAGHGTTVRLWRIYDGMLLRTLQFPRGRSWYWQVYSISFSPDGMQLAVGLQNGTVQLWG